jgi:protein gp37
MAEKSLIAWTENTFNAAMGCVKISPGCKNCYAETLTKNRMGLHLWGPETKRQRTTAAYWRKPLQWNAAAAAAGRRMLVFCGSLFDWAEDHPDIAALQPDLWNLIRATPFLDWQLLTKRAARIWQLLPADWREGYPNVWLGTSIESDDYAYRANAYLREIPATVRFVSYEPALGPLPSLDTTRIDWLIYGGESGPGWRPEDKAWARQIRARCARTGTAFFHKQSAAPRTEMGIELDGAIVRAYPVPRIATIGHAWYTDEAHRIPEAVQARQHPAVETSVLPRD